MSERGRVITGTDRPRLLARLGPSLGLVAFALLLPAGHLLLDLALGVLGLVGLLLGGHLGVGVLRLVPGPAEQALHLLDDAHACRSPTVSRVFRGTRIMPCDHRKSDEPCRGFTRRCHGVRRRIVPAARRTRPPAHRRGLPAGGSACGHGPRPTASRPRRCAAARRRRPTGTPGRARPRPRTWCRARRSPRACILPAATRRPTERPPA